MLVHLLDPALGQGCVIGGGQLPSQPPCQGTIRVIATQFPPKGLGELHEEWVREEVGVGIAHLHCAEFGLHDPPSSPPKSVRDYTISMPWSIQTSGMDSVNLARALNVNLELREPAESGFDLRKDGRIRFSGAGLVQCRFCLGGPGLPQ